MAEKKLSKNVEGMKFMQRKREAELRSKLQEEQEISIKESHWVLNPEQEDLSRVSTYGMSEMFNMITTTTGRKSFGKFNPTIEKLNQDVDEDNRRAIREWKIAQGLIKPEIKSKEKEKEELKWVKKVQGSGGLDGAMSKDTISAAEMAQRFNSLGDSDGDSDDGGGLGIDNVELDNESPSNKKNKNKNAKNKFKQNNTPKNYNPRNNNNASNTPKHNNTPKNNTPKNNNTPKQHTPNNQDKKRKIGDISVLEAQFKKPKS